MVSNEIRGWDLIEAFKNFDDTQWLEKRWIVCAKSRIKWIVSGHEWMIKYLYKWYSYGREYNSLTDFKFSANNFYTNKKSRLNQLLRKHKFVNIKFTNFIIKYLYIVICCGSAAAVKPRIAF